MAELTIRVASHHFVATRISPRGRLAVEAFAKRNVQYGFMRRPNSRRYVHAPIKVFAATTVDRTEFRFHINQLKEFKDYLKSQYLDGDLVEFEEVDFQPPVKVEFKFQPQWTDREEQIPVIDYLKESTPRTKFVNLQTGKGKAQPLDAKVRIPNGWKTMGELSVNDKVVAWDGTSTNVVQVHPQGMQEIFKVTFADGRSTECTGDHLWEVFYINTTIKRRWRVVNTVEMMRLISMPNPRVYVKLIKPEETPDINLPMDPYVFGLILGDVHIGKVNLSFTNIDFPIINELVRAMPSSMAMTCHGEHGFALRRSSAINPNRNEYLEVFRSFGLAGKLSHEKFVPNVFLNGSVSQRLAIVQGLLDTDGTVQTSGSVSFSSTSYTLAKNVQYLIRSLGGIAAIRSRFTSFTHKGEKKKGRECFDVDIRYPKASELFRLPRKIERTNDLNQYADTLKLRVTSIESCGQKEAQCISVEHPDQLYVTDDFVVTHNSYCTMRAMGSYGFRTLIIVKPMYLDKWLEDLRRTYELEIEDVITVRGGEALQALLEMAEDGRLTSKIILMSNKTLQNWIKLYEQKRGQFHDLGYPCYPEQLCEHLGVGVRVIDEVHQDFHLNFKIDLYTHVPVSILLSATLISDDPFVTKMHEVMCPVMERYQGAAYDKYVSARAVFYKFVKPELIRWQDPARKTYSHVIFEQSIMRQRHVLNNYMSMIKTLLDHTYMKDKKPTQKAMVFMSTKEMCTLMTDYLKGEYPALDVRRYIDEDPYENVMEADIRVSTLMSAGTAVDIDNLTTVILTIAIASSSGNIQGLWRLRKLKDGTTPQFLYLACEDLQKHLDYHHNKRVILETRALNYRSDHFPRAL